MVASNITNSEELGQTVNPLASNHTHQHLHASGVSWPAILAGATAAAALSLILLMLGTGLGLSSISPWASKGVNSSTFGISVIVWLSITQILASGMGGYIAGRLRHEASLIEAPRIVSSGKVDAESAPRGAIGGWGRSGGAAVSES